MNNDIMVSICCQTFNHALYIRDCLEGIIKQKTDFKYEILIHDDASTDTTISVINEYVKGFPNVFNPIFQKENQYSKGVSIWHDIQFPRASGKYIAICEGDDYWIDSQKLQKQIDFMEANPEYTMCITGTDCIDAETKEKVGALTPYESDTDIPLEDLIYRGGGDFGTPSFLVRTDAAKNVPNEIKRLCVGDYPLQMYMGYLGKVRYLADITAAYRTNSFGSWTQRMLSVSLDKRKIFWTKQKEIMTTLDKLTEYKYSKVFDDCYKNWLFHECRDYHQYKMARKIWKQTDNPINKYGWTIFSEIYNLNFIFKPLKWIVSHLKKS